MVGLPRCMAIQGLIVHNSTGLTILFWLDHHPAAPFVWCIYWDFLYNTKADIHIKTAFNCLLPVERDMGCLGDGHWFGILVNMEVERRRSSHEWEWLSLAGVKS